MRLKSVFISEYKNLKDFSLSFEGDSFIDIFVGKNGSGKSNLLEALIDIFQHILSFDNDRSELYFNYSVKYVINTTEVEIRWHDGDLCINGKSRKTIGKTPVPENVLVYYSGHNDSVEKLVQQYESKFSKRIRAASTAESRQIIGIGPNYKELLLAVLLMQSGECKARDFIKQKLGIRQLGLEIPGSQERTAPIIKLVLERPDYANDNHQFDIENNDEKDRYWQPEGITKDFLDKIHTCINPSPGGLTVTNGYLSADDRYVLFLDIDKIQTEFQESTSQELFRQFDNLKTLGMLTTISVPLALEGNTNGAISYFSDGQFQSVYIYAITELFKDKHCITLLDEPDAFLHPEWQFEFLKQIFEISEEATKTNHVLMSSHSAATLIPSENSKIKFFDIKAGFANCYDLPKRQAIQKLSNNLIKYREEESLLSIINTIQIENKPIFFAEGSTDPIILTEAWHQLYEEEIPFIPFYAFSCTYINQLITDQRIHAEMKGLPIFAMFDFDKAYNQWNGLNGAIIENDPSLGMVKKWENGEAYAFMLPIPTNPEIHRQVYRDALNKITFEGDSHCAIEHCFYGYGQTQDYFINEPVAGGIKITFSGDKTTFAKQIVSALPAEAFEVFRPIFEFIKSKCVADAAMAERTAV
jgi:predicted ATP-binding protein involved in virulence